MVNYEFVPPRLIRSQLKRDRRKFAIIGAYAPVAGEVNDANRENFYDKIQHLLNKIPAVVLMFLAGDFNARVGSDSEAWPRVVGPGSNCLLLRPGIHCGCSTAIIIVERKLVLPGIVTAKAYSVRC